MDLVDDGYFLGVHYNPGTTVISEVNYFVLYDPAEVTADQINAGDPITIDLVSGYEGVDAALEGHVSSEVYELDGCTTVRFDITGLENQSVRDVLDEYIGITLDETLSLDSAQVYSNGYSYDPVTFYPADEIIAG